MQSFLQLVSQWFYKALLVYIVITKDHPNSTGKHDDNESDENKMTKQPVIER